MDVLGGGLAPLEGGFSGETFLAEAAGERTVVRIYAHSEQRRGPRAAEIDAAVLRLVRGLVPVPDVLEVRRADPTAGRPALLVTSFLPGTRLDLVLDGMAPDMRRTVASGLGQVLSRLSGVAMLRQGMFVDGELRIGPMPEGAADLVEWVTRHRQGTALGEWPQQEFDALVYIADVAQRLLDGVDRCCLVHSDFNPKNILVDPATGEVTGLLDWEFAHAGLPVTDLGNLLRFERDPAFVEAVVAAYSECAATPTGDLVEVARAADLWALVDLAARRAANPVAARAHDLLRAIARSGDLHATT